MTTGSSPDILSRVRKLIPKGWFQWAAPNRDAILGALSDRASWAYGLIGYVRAQGRLASAYGIWLDVFSLDYLGSYLPRRGLADPVFRNLIRATILQERVTRAGMINALTTLTGVAPTIFEPWNTGDTGAWSSPLPNGFKCGQFGYGVGRGGYGSMNLPGQALLKVSRTAPSGIPNVAGYGSPIGGYKSGAIQYVGADIEQTGVTDDTIYDLINKTKPTGTAMWVAFTPAPQILTDDSGNSLTDDSGDTLTTL